MRSIRQISSFLIPVIAFTSLVIFIAECAGQETAKEKELKATVRRVFEEAWNKGNVEILDEVLTADCVLHIVPYPDFEGPDGYKRVITFLHSMYPDLQYTIDEIIVKGETTATRFTFRGTHWHGIQVKYPGCFVSHRVDGKVVEEWIYLDHLDIQQQLGYQLITQLGYQPSTKTMWRQIKYPEETAYAIPLKGIKIDGNLDDWPEDMIRYPILKNWQAYGPTDIDNADLTASADLTPGFMVGFSPQKNLIYVAVRVRDDAVVAGSSARTTDNCDVYVDGLNSHRKVPFDTWEQVSTASDLPALQYSMFPPGGSYGADYSSSDKPANPDINRGDIARTKTVGAYTREGDITIYEWAVEVFDHYPDSATKLEIGKTIGFDVAVADKDSETENAAWVCWGPFGGMKFFDADLLGELVLVKSYAEAKK